MATLAARAARGPSEDSRDGRRCRCRACHLRNCKACRDFYANTADWVAASCRSGEPLPNSELSRRPSRRRSLGGAEGTRRSVRRAWTISSGSSSPRWSVPRREVREYSSLPRNRSSGDYPSLRRGAGGAGAAGHGLGADQGGHTDSGVGTQDEAEHGEPLHLVRTMLERARQREDALKTVSNATRAARPVSLSLLGLGTAGTTGSSGGHSATSASPTSGPASSSVSPSAEMFPRRGSGPCGAPGPPGPPGPFGRSKGLKGLKGRRRRSAGATAISVSPQQQQTEWSEGSPGSPCARARRRCPDPGGGASLPAGAGAAAEAETGRSLLEGDDFRLVFISSDSSSRDEDEPRSEDDDEEDIGDCMSTSSGGMGPALDDCDWDYFEPSVAPRELPESPVATPVLRRHRHARVFLDGSPSSSDCSSSGWATYQPGHYTPHRDQRDWDAGRGGVWARVPGVVLGPSSICCRSPQHGRRHVRLDAAQAAQAASLPLPVPNATATEATAAAGTGSGTSTTGQVGPVGPIPGPSQARAVVVAQRGAVSGCASCSSGSLVPILVPIPVPVPVLVPIPQYQDDVSVAMRPQSTGGGQGGGRRRKGGRGRRSGKGTKTTAASPAPASTASSSIAPGGDGGRRVSRSSSVAEETDNGVVLVTFRQIKEDAKPDQDQADGAPDDAEVVDDDAVFEDPMEKRLQEAGKEEEGKKEDDEDGDEVEMKEDEKSSCASTSSSDDDTNVDFDSDSVDVDDDSDDEEVSRTYRLRDGATLTRGLGGLRSEVSASSSSSRSSRSSVGSGREKREDDEEEDDSDGEPFSQVFVVNSPSSTDEDQKHATSASSALSKSTRVAASADSGPRVDRCAQRPRAAPPPPPPPPSATPVAPPASDDTSQVTIVACSGTEAASDTGASVGADAASGETAPAVPAALVPVVPVVPVVPAGADIDTTRIQDDPPGLSTPCAEPSDGMKTKGPDGPSCPPSATGQEGAATDMFGMCSGEPEVGVAALNKEVIGVVAPEELARLGGHLECLSVIECPAASGNGSTAPAADSPVALKDILRDESLRPEAEMQTPAEEEEGDGDGEFSGTESMELSPPGHDQDGVDPDHEGQGLQSQQQQPQQHQQSVERSRRSASGGAAVEGIESSVSPLDCAAGAADAAVVKAQTAMGPCLAGPESELCSRSRSRSPAEEAVVGRASSAHDEAEVEAASPKYTSLVMITPPESPVSVSVGPASGVTLLHTNLEEVEEDDGDEDGQIKDDDEEDDEEENAPLPPPRRTRPNDEDVQVVTGADTLSAVICLEEGMADDDSWVEEVEPDRDMDMETTATDTSSGDEGGEREGAVADREEELRGYHRAAIDFTLHTILEESCEESESESNKPTPRGRVQSLQSASELEKYFFFELGGGTGAAQQDAMSESNSSIYSEGLESLGTEDGYGEDGNTESQPDPAELASSRLEKYFLSGFMGFPGSSRRDSDGSVGSDSEGRPSPEQRRKRLVRARGTGRAAHSSQDNLASPSPQQPAEPTAEPTEVAEDADDTEGSSTEEESPGAPGEEPALAVDGQFDTVKRKKRKRSVGSGPVPSQSTASAQQQGPGSAASASSDERDVCVSPAPGPAQGQDLARSKHHSRDSGFVGSCDDLLNKTASDSSSSSGQSGITTPADASPAVDSPALLLPSADVTAPTKAHTPTATASSVSHPGALLPPCTTTPPATSLTRRDSFNNWSSDEETNLMMSKMRAFFKNMTGRQQAQQAQQPAPQDSTPQQQQQQQQQARRKPPQLVYFESELTRLMKTVPGIRDEQVRELVEYLSSEDTWSDSYDSSDYTSSDLESATGVRASSKRALQEQISASCQQIISNFDTASDSAAGPGHDDTSVVYQRLIASLSRMGEAEARPGARTASAAPPPPHASPPIFAKVMQHIGGRLVALMHEVSGQAAPRERYVHRRLQQKVSVASTTTEEDEDDDSVTDTEPDRGVGDAAGADVASPGTGTGVLARSRSHDLLGERDHGHDLNAEEREASDYERFSWRGSFESALMAADSRSRLSCGADSMTSPVSTAAKRRSAGDLLYSHRSRERLDRVRSCGSIGGTALCTSPGPGTGPHGGSSTGPGAELTWKARRASVPDANMSGGSADGDDDDDGEDEPDDEDDDHDHHHHHEVTARSTTLPRSLQATRGAGTNSLPRLPTSGSGSASTAGLGLLKANTLGQVQGVPGVQSVQSARYRPPGYSRQSPSATSGTLGNPPKRAMSAPGLGPHPAPHPRRERRKHLQQSSQGEFSVAAMRGAELRSKGDESCLESSEAHLSTSCTSYSASPSPVSSRATTQRPTRTLGRDWLPDEDVLAARLQPLGPIPHVTNLGRSDSLASVYSGAGEGRYGTVAVRGEVEFGLQYNYKQNALEIHVVQCKDLAPVDVKRNRSDPYVKVYLLPDKSKGGKRKTRVKKHTLNPYFDETLKFHINLKGLESRTLWLTVWHSDMFGRNDFLGEVMMNLEKKVFDDPSPRFYPLQERTEPFDDVHSYRGDMIVALKFIPPDVSGSTLGKKGKRSSKGELHVLVKEAKNLTAVKANGMSDPFCKSYLLPDKGRSSKQKTAVIRRSCNPAWNHTFIYSDISLQELSERSLELTVWDHDRIASNEFLGGVRFNLGTGKHYAKPVDWMDSSGKELTLWQRMLERPNLWVESSITLRTSLERTVASSSNTTT